MSRMTTAKKTGTRRAGSSPKTKRSPRREQLTEGPAPAALIASALFKREATAPERCLSVTELASEANLSEETVLRVSSRIVLGAYAVLPFSNLDRGLVGFYLADDAATDLAAERLLEQTSIMRARAREFRELADWMRAAKVPTGSVQLAQVS